MSATQQRKCPSWVSAAVARRNFGGSDPPSAPPPAPIGTAGVVMPA